MPLKSHRTPNSPTGQQRFQQARSAPSRPFSKSAIPLAPLAGLAACVIAVLALPLAKKAPPPSSIFEGAWAAEQNPRCDTNGKFYRLTPNSLEFLNEGRITNVTDKLEVTEDPKTVRVEFFFRNEAMERRPLLARDAPRVSAGGSVPRPRPAGCRRTTSSRSCRWPRRPCRPARRPGTRPPGG